MSDYQATNAASSGVVVDKKHIKQLSRRSDKPGLIWLAQWLGFLLATSYLIHSSQNTVWLIPAMFLHGIFLTVPAYSLSHECAHGTAFKNRTINEVLFWISSFIYFEEPYHRRYAHTRHHTYTWINGKDAQMPFETPMDFKGWLLEVSGLGLFFYELKVFFENATGRFSDITREHTPESELPKLQRGAIIFLSAYATLIALAIAGYKWPLLYLIIPRILGGPVMLLFTLIQHVEMQENQVNILNSTRSFTTNWLARFLYMNMNNHVEHHLYPMVPFHQLPQLNESIKDQLYEPDPGFFRTNLEVLSVVIRRSLGKSTKAATIRQDPSMINS